MKLRDEMRSALKPAAHGMDVTIRRLRELGQHEAADDLAAVRDRWVTAAGAAVRKASPRGRAVVRPIAGALEPLPPGHKPVGVDEWARYVPMLRAQHAVRDVPPLRVRPIGQGPYSLAKVRAGREVLDAG